MSLGIEHPSRGEIIITKPLPQDGDEYFTQIIGCIEDMLVNNEFLEKQTVFLEKYWQHFEENEENKLIYMSIFKEYQDDIEQFIENYLKKTVKSFSMDSFIDELQGRRDNLHGEIFEVLFTLTDFLHFKEMILDYKAMKEGRTLDTTSGIVIKKISVTSINKY